MDDRQGSGSVEGVVTYRGGWMFVLLPVSVIVFTGIAAVAGSFIGFALCGALAMSAASSDCRRIGARGGSSTRWFIGKPSIRLSGYTMPPL